MSTSTTPPPPTGGNAKYIVLIVVLLGGIGGLIAWKSSHTEEGPKPLLALLDAGPPASHVEDDMPPPPPIVDSGPDTGPTKTANFVGTVGNVCGAAKCNGSLSPDLEQALAARARQAHRCYDTALAQDATLKGRVSISVRVASNGQVCSANVATNELSGSSVAQCVANTFRQAGHFPSPTGGCVDTAVPISFVPGGR